MGASDQVNDGTEEGLNGGELRKKLTTPTQNS